jgi:BirA family transcriptional regulator, biotin operon repressor / biotin---[acetyl-CoA-carboxylase] ligase
VELSTQPPIGTPFTELLTVDSTNNYAMGMVHAGMAQHGAVVFTTHQTQGRGQRGKQWLSEEGSNLALSIVVEPYFLAPSEAFLLSMAIANGVWSFFNSYVAEYCSIKWPNDLYWQDRKAGGILIENVWQGGQWKFAIAGIGININQTRFPGLENRAVSLRQITGRQHELLSLAKELCVHLELNLKLLQTDKQATEHHYLSHLYRRNEWARLKKGSRVFDARIITVTPLGELVVQHAAEEKFAVGEVEWVI